MLGSNDQAPASPATPNLQTRKARPPYDKEVEVVLAGMRARARPLDLCSLAQERASMPSVGEAAASLSRQRDVVHREFEYPAYQGTPRKLSIIEPSNRDPSGPVVVYFHGGGMVAGTRFTDIEPLMSWARRNDAAVITPEYRLAPENPAPVPVEDCYAAFVWSMENSVTLGIGVDYVIVAGSSAGGGLAAGVCLLARDRRGPQPRGQLLMSPMLDDRNLTVSSLQFDEIGLWDRRNNLFGWSALLGDCAGGPQVSQYSAPARAVDLGGLPAAFLEVGSAEVFRDEVANYAKSIWTAGGIADLHVWAGGTHGFEIHMPESAIAQASRSVRDAWLSRVVMRG
jgi:acetyl esterase/lipase